MSNGWKDYLWDLRQNFDDNVECFDYDLPFGWVKSFVPKMKDELFDLLGPYAGDIHIIQAKEKFGVLVIYWCFPDKDYYLEEDYEYLEELAVKVHLLINKYSQISKQTCAICGRTAIKKTDGWILPVCDICFKEV